MRCYSHNSSLPALRTILGMLGIFAMLWSGPALADRDLVSCRTGPSGTYLRSDGRADQPWSIKPDNQPVVYVERCLIDQLLSYFPETVRYRLFDPRTPPPSVVQPAPWKTRSGETILTLSPRSRFQVAAAILYVESRFHPNSVPSSAGALGAFQVMPTTGEQMNLPAVNKPGTNLQAGLKYILYIEEQIARHCDFPERSKENSAAYRDLLAASYHAGPGYLARANSAGETCQLSQFPEISRTEYLARFRRALAYRYLPAYLHYDPSGELLHR